MAWHSAVLNAGMGMLFGIPNYKQLLVLDAIFTFYCCITNYQTSVA